MKHTSRTLFIRVFMLVMLCMMQYDVQAQGTWESIKEKASSLKEKASIAKEKASSAWHSEARENAWQKTKETASAITDSKNFSSMKYCVPVTERTFYDFVPDIYLSSISEKQYNSYLNKNTISTNVKQREQVGRVSKRLIAATKRLFEDIGRESELEDYTWQVYLVENNDANAFCMPGGRIIVYDGIIPVAQSDDALACVLGHEIAHAIAKHSSEQMTKGMISAVGLAVLTALITSSDMSYKMKRISAILASAGITLANLKFSRQNETEADRIGLILAAMAGYDPGAAVGFWERMNAKSTLKTSRDWFSTHPSHDNRISNIKSFLTEARGYGK